MSFSPDEPAVEWPAGHSVRRHRAEMVKETRKVARMSLRFVTVKKSKLVRMVNVSEHGSRVHTKA